MSVVAPVEADLLAVEFNKTVVGDCRFVREMPKEAQHLTRVRERGLGKDHPQWENAPCHTRCNAEISFHHLKILHTVVVRWLRC